MTTRFRPSPRVHYVCIDNLFLVLTQFFILSHISHLIKNLTFHKHHEKNCTFFQIKKVQVQKFGILMCKKQLQQCTKSSHYIFGMNSNAPKLMCYCSSECGKCLLYPSPFSYITFVSFFNFIYLYYLLKNILIRRSH